MATPGIAFFDLDRTLLSVNSATLWLKRELREQRISRLAALRAAGWVGLYQLGFGAMEDAIRAAVGALAGTPEDDIRARTLAFWHEEIVGTIRPGATAAIARHKERGQAVWLLTSSSPYLSRPAADALELDGFLSNVFEVVDGVFTGAAREPLCFGPGKITWARQVAEQAGVSLDQCAFYTDSHSDLPVLEAVGEPVVVHPDPRLRREAGHRGWRVEDWS